MIPPNTDEILESLRSYIHDEPGVSAIQLEPLASGLSASGVWRVWLSGDVSRPQRSFVLKIPDWQDSPILQLRTPELVERERHVFESGLLDHLQTLGIYTPRALGIDNRQGRTWIWMEDVGRLQGIRTHERAQIAIRACARFHSVYRAHRGELETYPWLSLREYLRYAPLLPAAKRNLEMLSLRSLETVEFSKADLEDLRMLLDAVDRIDLEMEALPRTLVHGDFHLRNMGLRADDGALFVMDWAHLGLAPLGCDAACFTSLYRLFGGIGGEFESGFDEKVIDWYVGALEQIEPPPSLRSSVVRACGLWHASWGLHLRLGAGLDAICHNVLHVEGRRQAEADIRDGCSRALMFFRRELSF
jgi:hypothetical protein